MRLHGQPSSAAYQLPPPSFAAAASVCVPSSPSLISPLPWHPHRSANNPTESQDTYHSLQKFRIEGVFNASCCFFKSMLHTYEFKENPGRPDVRSPVCVLLA